MPIPTKPTDLPEWSTGGGTDPTTSELNVIEPIAAKKVTGFQYGEYPGFNIFNWLFNTIYEWLDYFNDALPIMVRLADGNGVDVVPDSSTASRMYLFLAIETGTSNYVLGFGEKVGVGNPVTNGIASQVLTLPAGAGNDQAVAGATLTDVNIITISWEFV